MQTAEQVQARIIQLNKNHQTEINLLIEEYKRLSPIQIGDKVKVTYSNGKTELGECIGFDIQYSTRLEPIINKLKKDGTVSNVGRISSWVYSKIEKL